VRLEGLGKLKISDDLIGNGTRDLPACSTMLQSTTLPGAPLIKVQLYNKNMSFKSLDPPTGGGKLCNIPYKIT
jgi:hypothetical protein